LTKRLPSAIASARNRSCVSGRLDSTPYCSVTKRLSARIATAPSIAPRRHASSQGAAPGPSNSAGGAETSRGSRSPVKATSPSTFAAAETV
jgi:hypothetical protein